MMILGTLLRKKFLWKENDVQEFKRKMSEATRNSEQEKQLKLNILARAK